LSVVATTFCDFDPGRVTSPCFVIDRAVVEANLAILKRLEEESGAHVLAALKAFSCWSLGELTGRYLTGVCASGLHEALLGRDYYGGEIHLFSAAYSRADLIELLDFAHHVVFNSLEQWQRFRPLCLAAAGRRPELRFGLRINPQHSEGAVAIYDPCAPGSRLGIPGSRLEEADPELLQGISGLHFHTLCEQDFAPLARTLDVVEARFGHLLADMEWLNVGGGHHITRPGYQFDELVERIVDLRHRYRLDLYIEPGEAIAIHSGVLVSEVLDVTTTDRPQAILDTSATCHMPDTLEMPYRADIHGAGEPDELAHTYRLGGMSCLAGDVIGDYSFAEPLVPGQRLMFDDMSHYTMVKTTTFNGIRLPSIAIWDSRSDELATVRDFGYETFRDRLS
jgi:carboxynorspermidine decarboxylase